MMHLKCRIPFLIGMAAVAVAPAGWAQPDASPASARTTIETNALHLPTVLGGDAQPEQRIQYNTLGWPLEVCTGEQQAITCTRYSYDEMGRVIRTEVRDGAGTIEAATETEYDVLGMPTRIRTWVEGETWLEATRTYDANRNLIQVDAPNRAPVTMTYDGRNRLTSVTTADGTETYAYTPSGRLQSRTDRHGQTWTIDYDAYDRPAVHKDPDGPSGTRSGASSARPPASPTGHCSRKRSTSTTRWTASLPSGSGSPRRTILRTAPPSRPAPSTTRPAA
ncbi:MAG: hypothetical protein AAGN46_08820 [Acidobacteriota bacterium]